jgi:hypothetical protein
MVQESVASTNIATNHQIQRRHQNVFFGRVSSYLRLVAAILKDHWNNVPKNTGESHMKRLFFGFCGTLCWVTASEEQGDLEISSPTMNAAYYCENTLVLGCCYPMHNALAISSLSSRIFGQLYYKLEGFFHGVDHFLMFQRFLLYLIITLPHVVQPFFLFFKRT